jgi:hypothetical protein
MTVYTMPTATTTQQMNNMAASVQITSNAAMTTSVHDRRRAEVTDGARLGD